MGAGDRGRRVRGERPARRRAGPAARAAAADGAVRLRRPTGTREQRPRPGPARGPGAPRRGRPAPRCSAWLGRGVGAQHRRDPGRRGSERSASASAASSSSGAAGSSDPMTWSAAHRGWCAAAWPTACRAAAGESSAPGRRQGGAQQPDSVRGVVGEQDGGRGQLGEQPRDRGGGVRTAHAPLPPRRRPPADREVSAAAAPGRPARPDVVLVQQSSASSRCTQHPAAGQPEVGRAQPGERRRRGGRRASGGSSRPARWRSATSSRAPQARQARGSSSSGAIGSGDAVPAADARRAAPADASSATRRAAARAATSAGVHVGGDGDLGEQVAQVPDAPLLGRPAGRADDGLGHLARRPAGRRALG